MSSAFNKDSINNDAILSALKQSDVAINEVSRILGTDIEALKEYLGVETPSGDVPDFGNVNNVIVNVDGASRGNPGEAGIGIVFTFENNRKIGFYRYLHQCTNNEAEYRALIEGLKIAQTMKIPEVAFFADSQLVCHQVNGLYKVKNENLKKLYSEVVALKNGFNKFSITFVRREKNKDADAMANKAIDTKNNGEVELAVASC